MRVSRLLTSEFPSQVDVDILNRLNPSVKTEREARSSYVEPDPRKQMENARHFAKYVFPREYGLPNAFCIDKYFYGGIRLPNYFDREDQIQVANIMAYIASKY